MRRLLRDEPRLLGLLIAFACTFAFFLERPAWNQNSRLALTRAVVERGSIDIDDSHQTTGDKSLRDGHYYSDKAPGASWMAIPAYAALHGLRQALDLSPPSFTVATLDPLDALELDGDVPDELLPGDKLSYSPAHRVALGLCALATSGLSTLAVILALFVAVAHIFDHGLSRPGVSTAPRTRSREARDAALTTCLVYGLCTPALAYATAFYGHQPAASGLFCAWVLVQIPTRLSGRGAALLAGSLCGLAVTCEYPSAAPVSLLTLYAIWARGPRFAAWMAVAGLPWAVALALYHQAAFGHPLSIGYDHLARPEFAEGMRVRYGVGAPSLTNVWALLFGNHRGLFFASPVLLLAPVGLASWLMRAPSGSRAPWVVPVAVCVFYVLFNSGYYMWNGGAAFGPRHCLPMLPFLALGIAAGRRALPVAFWCLAGLSLLHALAGAAVGPELPEAGDPIWGAALPGVSESGPGPSRAAPQTLGHLLGLPGWLGLAPLVALWLLWRPWQMPENAR